MKYPGVFKKIGISFLVALAAGLCAYFLTNRGAERYKSSARLGLINLAADSSGLPSESFDRTPLQEAVEIMKSGQMGAMVSYRLLLHDLLEGSPFSRNKDQAGEENGPLVRALQKALEAFEPLPANTDQARLVTAMLESNNYDFSRWIVNRDLEIIPSETEKLITIEFVSEDPDLSAFVVNTLCEEFIRRSRPVAEVSGDSIDFYSVQVALLRDSLDVLDEQLRSLEGQTVTSVSRSSASDRSMLDDNVRRLRAAMESQTKLTISINKIKDQVLALSQAGDDNAHLDGNRKIQNLNQRIDELNEIYVRDGSQDKALAETIHQLRRDLEAEIARLQSEVSGQKRTVEMNKLLADQKRLELERQDADASIRALKSRIHTLSTERAPVSIPAGTDEIIQLRARRDRLQESFVRATDRLRGGVSASGAQDEVPVLVARGVAEADSGQSHYSGVLLAAIVSGALSLCIMLLSGLGDDKDKQLDLAVDYPPPPSKPRQKRTGSGDGMRGPLTFDRMGHRDWLKWSEHESGKK